MGLEGCVEACHPSNVRGNRKEHWRERNIRKGKRDELFWGSPGWLRLQRICLQCRRCRRHRFDPWVRKIPWGTTGKLLVNLMYNKNASLRPFLL